MNLFYVFIFLLSALLVSNGDRAADVLPVVAARSCTQVLADDDANILAMSTSLLQSQVKLSSELQSPSSDKETQSDPLDSTPAIQVSMPKHQHSAVPAGAVGGKAAMTFSGHKHETSVLQETAQRTLSTDSNIAMSWASCHAAFRRLAARTGGSAVLGLFVVGLLATLFALVLLGGMTSRPRRDAMPAESLLVKPGTQDPRLVPQLRQPAVVQKPGQPARPATAPALPGSGGAASAGGAAFVNNLMSRAGLSAALPTASVGREPVNVDRKHLAPELVVQTPQGEQFFIDGYIGPEEKNASSLQVWRINGDKKQQKVMEIHEISNDDALYGHQAGMVCNLSVLGNKPVCFMNTNQTGHTSALANRHVTIYDIWHGGMDSGRAFATVEAEGGHNTVRAAYNNEIICRVQSGGYNADFGNIVDSEGRLIANVSKRGHGMVGLGMIHGAWQQNRRIVHVSQGQDVAMIICAIIADGKLS